MRCARCFLSSSVSFCWNKFTSTYSNTTNIAICVCLMSHCIVSCGRGALLYKWTALGVKKKNGMRGARWCDLIGSRIFGCSPGVPTQSLSDAVPGDRPDTSIAANQIAANHLVPRIPFRFYAEGSLFMQLCTPATPARVVSHSLPAGPERD